MTKLQQSFQQRRQFLYLPKYDYGQMGAYFVTICKYKDSDLFGDVIGGRMILNDLGKIVSYLWSLIPSHFGNVELDSYIIMPTHLHGILFLDGRGTAFCAPTNIKYHGPFPGSLSTIVRSFKSAATREINNIRSTPGRKFWQRNYYEHVIRSEKSLNRLRSYIIENPMRWDFGPENRAKRGPTLR